MKNQFTYLLCALFLLVGCGVPNQSVLEGTYGKEAFVLNGKIGMLSRSDNRMDRAQGISFYPANPVGDQLSFVFGFKNKDMYEGFREQIGKNILHPQKNGLDNFYIIGFTDKEIEINVGTVPKADYMIIEKVEHTGKQLRSKPFNELSEAIIITGKLSFHFDEILLSGNFAFTFGQCYVPSS